MDTGHPSYAEMKMWSVERIQQHLATCPGTRDGICIPGTNALGTAIQDAKHARWKEKQRLHPSTVSGRTNHRDPFTIALGILAGTHDEFGRKKK